MKKTSVRIIRNQIFEYISAIFVVMNREKGREERDARRLVSSRRDCLDIYTHESMLMCVCHVCEDLLIV